MNAVSLVRVFTCARTSSTNGDRATRANSSFLCLHIPLMSGNVFKSELNKL